MKTIRTLRREQGFTQLDLAYRLGCTPTTVHNWERGKYKPRAEQLLALAAVFRTRVEAIALDPPTDTQPDSATRSSPR